MAHKVPGALSQNYRTGLAEIVEIVEPGMAQLTKVWETKLAKFSKPMQDEVYGRFYCVYGKTMDSAKGLAKLRENQECDVLQDKFFEVVADVETSNKIMMKFKQNLPTKDILEAIAGLSAKGKERISKELKKTFYDANKSEFEVAFENTFGKMDQWAHRRRHLFVLENIQNETRGLSHVKEHLSHLDPIFAKDIRRILKNELNCNHKTANAKHYNNAARILIQELKTPKKSDSQITLDLLEEIKDQRGPHSELDQLIRKLDQPTFEKLKNVIETRSKTTYSVASSDYRRNAAGALLEELKAAQKSGGEKTKNDPEAELKREIGGLDAQLAILEQLEGAYSSDVDLISKLRGSLNKQNQERFDQYLQVFNSQPEFTSISSYKAAVAVSELVELAKQVKGEKLTQLQLDKMGEKVEKLKLSETSDKTPSTSSSRSSEKTSEKKGPEAQLNDELEVLTPKKSDSQMTLDLLEEIKNQCGSHSVLDQLIRKLDQPTFEKLKNVIETRSKTTYLDASSDYRRNAAGVLLEELKAAQKSGGEKTKIDPEAELKGEIDSLDAQLAILQQIKEDYQTDSAKALRELLDKDTKAKFDAWLKTSSKVTPDTVTEYIDLYDAASHTWTVYVTLKQEKTEQLKKLKQPQPDPSAAASDAKPKFDPAKEIARYDTQIERLLLLIAEKGKTHKIDQKDQIDDKAGDDVDEVLREEFETIFAQASEEQLVKAALIMAERYRFEKQVAILRDIDQTNGTAQSKWKITPATVGKLDAMLHDHCNTSYEECSESQLAIAARRYLQSIEEKKVKAQKGFQTTMNALVKLIGNDGYVDSSDDFGGTFMPDMNTIIKAKYGKSSWTDADGPQTAEAAKILLRKYLMRPNPLSKDWHEAGIKDLKQIIADNGKVLGYPSHIVLKNLDAILMDRYGVSFLKLNDDTKVLAAAQTLLRRYEAVQEAAPEKTSEKSSDTNSTQNSLLSDQIDALERMVATGKDEAPFPRSDTYKDLDRILVHKFGIESHEAISYQLKAGAEILLKQYQAQVKNS